MAALCSGRDDLSGGVVAIFTPPYQRVLNPSRSISTTYSDHDLGSAYYVARRQAAIYPPAWPRNLNPIPRQVYPWTDSYALCRHCAANHADPAPEIEVRPAMAHGQGRQYHGFAYIRHTVGPVLRALYPYSNP